MSGGKLTCLTLPVSKGLLEVSLIPPLFKNQGTNVSLTRSGKIGLRYCLSKSAPQIGFEDMEAEQTEYTGKSIAMHLTFRGIGSLLARSGPIDAFNGSGKKIGEIEVTGENFRISSDNIKFEFTVAPGDLKILDGVLQNSLSALVGFDQQMSSSYEKAIALASPPQTSRDQSDFRSADSYDQGGRGGFRGRGRGGPAYSDRGFGSSQSQDYGSGFVPRGRGRGGYAGGRQNFDDEDDDLSGSDDDSEEFGSSRGRGGFRGGRGGFRGGRGGYFGGDDDGYSSRGRGGFRGRGRGRGGFEGNFNGGNGWESSGRGGRGGFRGGRGASDGFRGRGRGRGSFRE